jgi:hypothetical protein
MGVCFSDDDGCVSRDNPDKGVDDGWADPSGLIMSDHHLNVIGIYNRESRGGQN